MGGNQSGRSGAIVRREEISRLESGAQHGRDFTPTLCPERVRRRSRGEFGRGGNENRRYA